MLPLLLLACATPGGDDAAPKDDTAATTDDTAETGETGDTAETGETADTAPACATINAGKDWEWTGECPGMTTPVVIAVDGCALTLDYDPVGGMTMGMPYSATVDGDTVTFADDNSVHGCVGTVESADRITGSCGSGCTFRLKR